MAGNPQDQQADGAPGWDDHIIGRSNAAPENDCPNCSFSHPHVEIDEKCMLWELLTVRATDTDWTVEEMRERIRRVNVDAFWEQLGPVLDQLVDGDFDYTEEELRKLEAA